MTKGRLTIRIIVGGYLAYIGFGLVRDVMAEKPENSLLYLIIGVFFMAVGGVWCFLALKRYVRHEYEDIWEGPEDKKTAGDEEEIAENDAGNIK